MLLKGLIEKGWGCEHIWCSNDKYCGKFLHFKTGGTSSMHFHAVKDETWHILSGAFRVSILDTADASRSELHLRAGDTLHLPALTPHQVRCIESGTIIEVSTPDSIEDNYRVAPGDSQAGR